MDIANVWLQSGLPSVIRGGRIVPQPHPKYPNIAWSEEGKQGLCYHLLQVANQRQWILKRFHPTMLPERAYLHSIRNLLPTGMPFTAGLKRALLTAKDVRFEEGTYCPNDLLKWVEDAVLMPKLPGATWHRIAQELRKGTLELTVNQRLSFARCLAEAVEALEDNGCAHRDLCQQNLLLDRREYIIYLADWDSIFHGSLYFQKTLPIGTEGYIAPWAMDKSGKWDIRKTWQAKADRFSLAILITELLTLGHNSSSYHDGSLFSQDMFRNSQSETFEKIFESLAAFSTDLQDLLERVFRSTTYEECPEPRDWIKALDLDEKADVKAAETVTLQEDDEDEFSTAKLNLWLLVLILVLPLIFWIVYQIRERSHQVSSDISIVEAKPREPLTTSPANPVVVPQTDVQTSEMAGAILEQRTYEVSVDYADNDLKMTIEGQPITLNKGNSAIVQIRPGAYNVTLTFTSVFIDSKGDLKRGPVVPRTNKVQFDQENTKIKIFINRIERTWSYSKVP